MYRGVISLSFSMYRRSIDDKLLPLRSMFRVHAVEENVLNKVFELDVNLDSYKYKYNIVFVHFELE